VERELLIRLLGDGNEAFAACRQAVVDGARFDVYDGAVPGSHLASIYEVRDRHAQRIGLPTLGFSAAVHELQMYGEQPIRVGSVDVDDPPYHFALFLDEKLSSVVACLGVDQAFQAHRHGPKN
jgi:hypothetical protein